MSEIRVRPKREFERHYSPWYVVAPGTPLHDRGIEYRTSEQEWREGAFNYTQEQYQQQVMDVVGYIYFYEAPDSEPTQAVFDAFCVAAKLRWNEYRDWYQRKGASNPGYWLGIEMQPFVPPRGTARIVYESVTGEPTHWVKTDRTPSIPLPE